MAIVMTPLLHYSSPHEGNEAGASSPQVTPARCCHGAPRKGSCHTHREQSSLEQNTALNQLLCYGFPLPLRQLRVSTWQLPPVSPCLERSLLFPSGPVLCCCSPDQESFQGSLVHLRFQETKKLTDEITWAVESQKLFSAQAMKP